ncbi:SSL2 DNA or RNA helicases of superfamily II [uncultured Caudovirales phage]|uniref:SSL2 DNA or RNA helicases of superfamily II n=1 Tax=uncultured Caudovirales phage TaxID=2100421 RepID=A0A6J5KYX0_9CAUD|nr:SSL2 DNA or RNA helicases of superfamily II [uncultured Caudovirales phage]
MILTQTSPIRVEIDASFQEMKAIKEFLTYEDKSVVFEINRTRNNKYLKKTLGDEAFVALLLELNSKRHRTLVNDNSWTYSGLSHKLLNKFGGTFVNNVSYPEEKIIPYQNVPKHKPRYFQNDSCDALIEAKHGAVSIGTGLGKTTIIQMLVKHFGQKAVVMAPSVSIAEQMYLEFQNLFGRKYVGFYGDGTKECKKLITIGIGQSLTRIVPGSPDYKALSKATLFIVDESHLTPAATLESVCFGLMANAPYRFFFSATQFRNDGRDLLLAAITGPIVYNMTVKEGIDQGFLSKLKFMMFETTSDVDFYHPDTNKMTSNHLFYNKKVNALAAELANKHVEVFKRPVLILIDEIEQFVKIYPLLKHKFGFAHGTLTKENSKGVPEEFLDSNTTKLVNDFNAGVFPILIGTSCVSTGTDIQAVQTMIRLKGGTSEISVMQDVGRCTRLSPGKTDCFVIDFDIVNIEALEHHAANRREIYNSIYGQVQNVRIKS